jgi:lipocalin
MLQLIVKELLNYFLPPNCDTVSMLVVLAAACAAAPSMPLEVVPQVDLNRYVGKWYEIASFPTWFQKGCAGSTAAYSLRADGNIDVLNQS